MTMDIESLVDNLKMFCYDPEYWDSGANVVPDLTAL